MIPEAPNYSEAKATMIACCYRDPQIGEIFEVTASGVTETWIMSGITWEREMYHDVRGYAYTLPLRPKMSFEFKVLPAGMPLSMSERMECNNVVRASQWRYWMEQGILEYIGCLDLFDPSCVQLLKPRLKSTTVNSYGEETITDEL